ncbi:MAG: NAD-dependent epimerase/dehydratase family protein [Chitinophagaceae bacterium]|nr:NAD-dependent epimerase/dehydratase family protein [Chitinophagaceae bacterium]
MILVTGGTGLLGSYLLRELAAREQKVIALYRKEIPKNIDSPQIQWINGDILDVVLLEEIMEQVDFVYHCAATVSFNPRKNDELKKVNIEGTANVVNASLKSGVQKLVHVSSVSALGVKHDGSLISENSAWEQDRHSSFYSRSKYFAELEVWRGMAEGLKSVIVNPSLILGAGNWENGSSALFKKAWEEFPWYTEGGGGMVDAGDVARVMILLMESEITNERFIINAENRSFKELFTRAAERFGKRPPHKKASRFMTGLLWRIEKIRTWVTGSEPLLTRTAAEAAGRRVYYDNTKLLKFLPGFQYKPLNQTIDECCNQYMQMQ